MLRKILKSKIHRATVTATNMDYEGSITIDEALMQEAGILPFEQLKIANLRNGERFETYVIPGPVDSGAICINGAAAHKAAKGDLIIIFQYVYLAPEEISAHSPRIVYVDRKNRIIRK
ncbi:MAG: aspartate 1-decarboxylase [Nitrospirae bacterium CG_4_9_14_3_um_filter_53_35]|nr:MAG: aspartate 1-decarboxylase [Nitrospirae bacterium CG2_30_53_67]PIS37818.1 MAG: aspartate 1-decarboxylase [Nitrospirae bacterium CG08_land_8_20_14_0_20_52_24]PIV84973.1 MAG: aspartate 1-decarboxylase [Nitrospirae bacterium CG17_big_fil_post_rev_8_21_14_2_50_50_9]PIX86087.1 MAG: aspartate 1-decarboxylase [Nitrospirae bacterium CG_4_10_14_3_um_filter_53_41]PJA77060.1 MAG: aspartate 1-decarboxylase [Nitrospirae bacterium CG_4_9_14_3_um_filter_53_35]